MLSGDAFDDDRLSGNAFDDNAMFSDGAFNDKQDKDNTMLSKEVDN